MVLILIGNTGNSMLWSYAVRFILPANLNISTASDLWRDRPFDVLLLSRALLHNSSTCTSDEHLVIGQTCLWSAFRRNFSSCDCFIRLLRHFMRFVKTFPLLVSKKEQRDKFTIWFLFWCVHLNDTLKIS